jgi:hypothetical protein
MNHYDPKNQGCSSTLGGAMVGRFIAVPVGLAKVAAAVRAIALTVPEIMTLHSNPINRGKYFPRFFSSLLEDRRSYFSKCAIAPTTSKHKTNQKKIIYGLSH